jgi:cytidylate kinase
VAIITISRGSYSRGKEVAERVAQKLGYECVARKVLLEASEEFDIPEYKLVRELHDAPSLLQRFSHTKEKYISLIRTAFLEHVQKDNVVYHGLAGRVFLSGVSHVLKVRIIADVDDRVREEMQREQLSPEKARSLLLKDDEERRKWSQSLYGTDNRDPANFDLCVHIRKLSVEDASEIIAQTAQLPAFQTTPQSQQALDDLLLASRVENRLLNGYDLISICAQQGEVILEMRAPLVHEVRIADEIREKLQGVDGLVETYIRITPTGYESW